MKTKIRSDGIIKTILAKDWNINMILAISGRESKLHIVLVRAISLMGGSPRANENRINIHFVRYTSEMRALFVFPHLYVLTKPGGRILFFRIGINIYFVRNTHLLHRRNIICRTEDTWLSQNRRYILLEEAILYDYISFLSKITIKFEIFGCVPIQISGYISYKWKFSTQLKVKVSPE